MITNANANEELFLDGKILTPNAAALKLRAEENLRIKKLFITNFKRTILAISEPLLNCQNCSLEILCLNKCDISHGDAQTISNFINGSSLLKLELSSCSIETPELITILDSVRASSVQKIKFQDFRIEERTARAIAASVTNEKLPLIELSFFNCYFAYNSLFIICNSINESTLKALILEDIHFTHHQAQNIADCIEKSALTKLSLRNSMFIHDTIFAIEEAIVKSSIKTLNLQQTTIYADATRKIYLMQKLEITNLDTGDTISIEETMGIIELVRRNPSIKKIFIKPSRSDQLLDTICDLLKDSHLTSLELQHYYLSEIELTKIFNAIKGSNIVSLNLISYMGIDKIRCVCDLLENYSLKKLTINNFSSADIIINTLIPVIKKSSLIKFKIDPMSWPRANNNWHNQIEQHLIEQRKISNGFYKTKSARSHS